LERGNMPLAAASFTGYGALPDLIASTMLLEMALLSQLVNRQKSSRGSSVKVRSDYYGQVRYSIVCLMKLRMRDCRKTNS
jgi:hypothetical protein